MKQMLHIVHLYPEEMNIYGDTGNRIILTKRLEWRGIEAKVSLIGTGDTIPDDTDIILGGGGQDAGQSRIQDDLFAKAESLKAMAEDGVAMLMICGMYQLFGRRFVTHSDEEIKGIGILPLETIAGNKRLIGNIVTRTPFGDMVGFENHSGLTMLDSGAEAFGMVLRGAGNNGKDKTEGCIYKNVFGTYMHGPALSKNPALADELIKRALLRKYGEALLQPLDDTIEHAAAAVAKSRPR